MKVPDRAVVVDDMLIGGEQAAAAADQRQRDLVALVVAAVHAAAEEDYRVVEDAHPGGLLDGIELHAELGHLAHVPPGDGREVVRGAVLTAVVVLGASTALLHRALFRERAAGDVV